MDREKLLEALQAVQAGEMTPEAALGLFAQAPYEDIGYAKIDHHRGLRNGSGEVIYGAGKTAEQIAGIVEKMVAAKMDEGQLDDSSISIRELNTVKESLKSYLAQLYHERVVYPKMKARPAN